MPPIATLPVIWPCQRSLNRLAERFSVVHGPVPSKVITGIDEEGDEAPGGADQRGDDRLADAAGLLDRRDDRADQAERAAQPAIAPMWVLATARPSAWSPAGRWKILSAAAASADAEVDGDERGPVEAERDEQAADDALAVVDQVGARHHQHDHERDRQQRAVDREAHQLAMRLQHRPALLRELPALSPTDSFAVSLDRTLCREYSRTRCRPRRASPGTGMALFAMGPGRTRHRQRLHGAQRRAAGDRAGLRRRRRHGPVDGQRLRAHVRDGARHRRPPRRHVRPPPKIFFIGTAIFAVFSLLGGLAQNAEQLIAMRVGMGVGGGLMWPAILGMTFAAVPTDARGLRGRPRPRRRGSRQRARAVDRRRAHRRDQLAGDLLPQHPGRRVRGRRHRREGPPARRASRQRERIDYAGIVTLSLGLVLLLLALDQSAEWGWGDAAGARDARR